MEDHCLVLPDVSAEDLLTFLRCLFAADKADWDGGVIAKLVHVGRTIGVNADYITSFNLSQLAKATVSQSAAETDRPGPPVAAKATGRGRTARRPRVVVNPEPSGGETAAASNSNLYMDFSGLSLFLDDRQPVLTSTTTANSNGGSRHPLADKKSLLKLSEISIDSVTDDVLTENFCDQDGRLGEKGS